MHYRISRTSLCLATWTLAVPLKRLRANFHVHRFLSHEFIEWLIKIVHLEEVHVNAVLFREYSAELFITSLRKSDLRFVKWTGISLRPFHWQKDAVKFDERDSEMKKVPNSSANSNRQNVRNRMDSSMNYKYLGYLIGWQDIGKPHFIFESAWVSSKFSLAGTRYSPKMLRWAIFSIPDIVHCIL